MERARLLPFRTALARVRAEDGISIVEMLFAAFILLVAMGAALSVITGSIVQSRSTRAVDVGATYANEQVETYRSFVWDQLALGPDYTGSATYTDDDGTTYPVVKDDTCTACPEHEETGVEIGDRTVDVTRWVLAVDDATDGTGAGDEDLNTIDYKRVIVEVTWDNPTPGSQTVQTNILPDEAGKEEIQTGIRVEIFNADNGLPAELDDDSVLFPVTILRGGTTVATDETIEGRLDLFNIDTGSYICRVSQATPFWHPKDEPNVTVKDYPCNSVQAIQMAANAMQAEWEYTPCMAYDGSADAIVEVRDPDGDALSGADVRLSGPTNGDDDFIGTDGTNGDGEATFSGVNPGVYEITVEHHIYDDEGNDTGYGTVSGIVLCVAEPAAGTVVQYPPSAAPEDEPSEDPSDSPTEPAYCGESATLATLDVDAYNGTDVDQVFRLKVEPDQGDKFYIPGKPEDLDEKFHSGALVEESKTHNFYQGLTPGKYKKIEFQVGKLKKVHDDGRTEWDWDKKHEWKDGDDWDKDIGFEAGKCYRFDTEYAP